MASEVFIVSILVSSLVGAIELSLADFENFFEAGEVSRSARGDQGHVFEAYAPELRIIKAGLDRHDLAGPELPG